MRAALAPLALVDSLTFHAADLLADAGWEEAVAEAATVIYVASPMLPRLSFSGTHVGECRLGLMRPRGQR